MSNDIGNKRPIDDIQDDKTAELSKVPSQETDQGHDVTDTNNGDTGVATETTTQNTISTTDVQESNLSKSQERRRGQRMFGMLMGTLNKFDKAQKQNEQQARKRQAIDAKLQERLLEEKMAIQASLLQSQQDRARKNQPRQVDSDENKLKQDAVHQKNLAHYLITTTTTTPLTYLPKKLLPHQQEQIDRQIRDANVSVTTTAESEQDNDKDQQDKEE